MVKISWIGYWRNYHLNELHLINLLKALEMWMWKSVNASNSQFPTVNYNNRYTGREKRNEDNCIPLLANWNEQVNNY